MANPLTDNSNRPAKLVWMVCGKVMETIIHNAPKAVCYAKRNELIYKQTHTQGILLVISL